MDTDKLKLYIPLSYRLRILANKLNYAFLCKTLGHKPKDHYINSDAKEYQFCTRCKKLIPKTI